MSERYGIWHKSLGCWCNTDGVIIVTDRADAEATLSCWGEGDTEVRPYPSPEAKPVSRLDPVDWECPGCGMWSPAARGWRLHASHCTWTNTPDAVEPSAIRQSAVIDAAALAMSLFASDPAVEAFVTARAENADRYEATLRIAFDRDENGWATHARLRAARIIARMAGK